MTYIKIDNKPYLDNINLRKILSISGEELELNDNTFILTKKNYPEIIDNIKYNAVYDIENKIIIKKTTEIIFKENKEKFKNELLLKSKNDPDFVFGKEEAKNNYKKIFDDIEKAMIQEELDLIEV